MSIITSAYFAINYQCDKPNVTLKDEKARDYKIKLHQKTCLKCKGENLAGGFHRMNYKNPQDIPKIKKSMEFIYSSKQ
jgi:hypothetical protein